MKKIVSKTKMTMNEEKNNLINDDNLSYKSIHKKNFQNVLNTLREIDRMIQITPSIAKECWGISSINKYKYIYYSRYIWNPRNRSDDEDEYDIENEMDFYEYGSTYF